MSENYEQALRDWVAGHLDISDEDIEQVEVDTLGGCSQATCDLNETQIEVTTRDGRMFVARQEFSEFLRDLVPTELYGDGTLRRDATSVEFRLVSSFKDPEPARS